MIARHILLFVLLVVLPYLYVDYRYFFRNQTFIWRRSLWWMPCLLMLAMTVAVASLPDFIPRNRLWIDTYLLLLGLCVIPVALFSICSALGWAHNRYHHTHQQWGERIGVALGALSALAFVYGFTLGFNKVVVKHMDLAFDNLPARFDGMRIVHVSDLHVGTYSGWRRYVLEQVIDSICDARPDLVLFTGDLQNTRPDEIVEVQALLRRLPHVYSVLGNHDHGEYIDGTIAEKKALEQQMAAIQRSLGWTLLNNQSVRIPVPKQGHDASVADYIEVCGTDNDGLPPFPSLADYRKTVPATKSDTVFRIMLQHDPSAWRRHILPQTSVQLTLSGHTHGGQMSLFGLRPTQLRYDEDFGLYECDGRYLHVSGGVGGLVPFRLGMPGEFTVITLHTKR